MAWGCHVRVEPLLSSWNRCVIRGQACLAKGTRLDGRRGDVQSLALSMAARRAQSVWAYMALYTSACPHGSLRVQACSGSPRGRRALRCMQCSRSALHMQRDRQSSTWHVSLMGARSGSFVRHRAPRGNWPEHLASLLSSVREYYCSAAHFTSTPPLPLGQRLQSLKAKPDADGGGGATASSGTDLLAGMRAAEEENRARMRLADVEAEEDEADEGARRDVVME